MELYWKTIGAILISVVLILTMEKQPSGLVLSIAVCVMAVGVALSYLSPVKDLLRELQNLADLQDGLMEILLQCTAIAIVSEVVGFLCQDAGADSLKKTVQFLGNCAILCLSVPVFHSLLTILKDILSEL